MFSSGYVVGLSGDDIITFCFLGSMQKIGIYRFIHWNDVVYKGINLFSVIPKTNFIIASRSNIILIACSYTDNNHIFLLLNELVRKGVKVIVLTRIIDNGNY